MSDITTIRVSEVLALLDQGKSRKQIAQHFGKTEAEMQRAVWSHPKLKGRKARKLDDISIVDDVEDTTPWQSPEGETDDPEWEGEESTTEDWDSTQDSSEESEEEYEEEESESETSSGSSSSSSETWQ